MKAVDSEREQMRLKQIRKETELRFRKVTSAKRSIFIPDTEPR
jgi:hypothetical protein